MRTREVINLASLYGSLLFNCIINLALISYIARILGPHVLGLVLLSQALGFWLAIVPEYGFSLSGGRAIARAGGDTVRIATIARSINSAKGFLALVTLPSCFIAYQALSGFHAHPAFVAGAGLFAVAQGFDPVWLFQGTERNVPYAIISSTARASSLALTLLMIKGPDDGELFMFIQALGAALISAAGLLYLRVTFPRARALLFNVPATLKENWNTFLYRCVQSLTTTSGVLILGFVSPSGVSGFGSAERIVRNCLGVLGPISAVGMPRISSLLRSDPVAAKRFARFSFAIMVAFGLSAGASIFLLTPLIVELLLGPAYGFVTPVLRVVALALPLSAASSMLSVQWMLPLGLEKTLVRVTLSAGLANITGCAVLGSLYSAIGVAVSMVAAEAALLLGIVIALARLGRAASLRA